MRHVSFPARDLAIGWECRSDAYQAILGAARGALLARIDALSPAQLLELLEASFPFISIPELQVRLPAARSSPVSFMSLRYCLCITETSVVHAVIPNSIRVSQQETFSPTTCSCIPTLSPAAIQLVRVHCSAHLYSAQHLSHRHRL